MDGSMEVFEGSIEVFEGLMEVFEGWTALLVVSASRAIANIIVCMLVCISVCYYCSSGAAILVNLPLPLPLPPRVLSAKGVVG